MIKQITDKTAAMIVKAADSLCDYVERGNTELEAGVKVAKEFGLTRDQIKLACRAYNAGVVNGDRDEGKTFFTKFAVTSRVDPDEVIEKVFPVDTKTATVANDCVADIYRPVPPASATDKTAAIKALQLDHDLKVMRKKRLKELEEDESKYTKAKKKVAQLNELRSDLRRLESSAGQKTAAVVDAYLSQFGSDTRHLLWVRKTAGELFGPVADMLIDPIADRLLGPVMREKFAAEAARGAVLAQQPFPITVETGIFHAVKVAIEAYQAWAKAELEFPKQAIDLRRQAEAELNRDAPAPCLLLLGETKESMEQAIWEKRSNMLMGMLAGASAKAGFGGAPSSGGGNEKANATLDAQVKLNDPAHQSELRRLSVEVMLNDLMNNDQVIASYSPDEIADAFEDIGQSAPGIVDNPSLLRANMRRHLQGNLTPFDAESLVNQSELGAKTNPVLPKPLSVLSGSAQPQKQL